MQLRSVVFGVVAGVLSLWRRLPSLMIWLVGVLCALGVGCGSAPGVKPMGPDEIPAERIRTLCWKPPELGPQDSYFIFQTESGIAEPVKDVAVVLARYRFVFKYDENASAKNLLLLPLSRPEAWCTGVPVPTDERVRSLLGLCPEPTSMTSEQAVRTNFLGQTSEPPTRSSFFCGQSSRFPAMGQELSLLRAKNAAYTDAYKQARKIANALTQAEADMQWVINKSDWSLKRLFTEDPGTLEQIQQRVADALDTIETPIEYDDPILEGLAMHGFQVGFEDGKFEVEAKLFAIDAGITILEFAALEVALGPLGGAKLLASAVNKGTKALSAAAARLADIPIFIPVAANGGGAFVRVGKLIGSVSAKVHRYRLRKALEAAMKRKKLAGESTHHMVAIEDEGAAEAREILKKFDLNIDAEYNGVFLPATKSSPNPAGSIVHATLRNKIYYEKVTIYLKEAKSSGDVIRRLKRIRETLLDGTFYDAIK